MLLVQDSMSREVVTLTPETTAAEALKLCRERGIRHLPVMQDDRLVGMVSDRDLRSATPALGDPARAAALEEIVVSGVMSREVATAHPEDPIEMAANAMRERGIGSLPVVEDGRLVGIITSSDVMEALVRLVGAHEPGSRIEVSMPDRPGSLAEVAALFRDADVNVVSALAGPSTGDDRRVAVFRAATIDPAPVVRLLEEAGYPVPWPPVG